MLRILLPVLLVATVLPAAAAARDVNDWVDWPVLRSLAWFDYAGATDLREACAGDAPGAPHIRVIYNGNYLEQVRTYEFIGTPDGGARLGIRIFGDENLANWNIGGPDGLIGPWKGYQAERRLDAGQMAEVRSALEQSDAFEPAAKRASLPATDFYWLVGACRDGVFTYHYWHYPKDAVASLGFIDELLALDPSEIPLNPPREDEAWDHADPEPNAGQWSLSVGPNGLYRW
jgi:hypothetical protein